MSSNVIKRVRMSCVRGIRFSVLGLFAAIVSGCPASSDAPTDPSLPTGFSITFAGPVTVPQNGSIAVPVTLRREPGFTGSVALSVDTKGSGITAASTTIASGDTVGTVVLTGDGKVATGDGPLLTITGSATGYAPASATRTTLIVAGGTFQIQPSNALNNGLSGRAEANPGFTLRRSIGISRNQYAKAITFTVGKVFAASAQTASCQRLCGAPISGFTMSFSPQPTTADTIQFVVTVPSTMTADLYELMLTAKGPDGVGDSTLVNFLVRSPTFAFGAASPVTAISRGGSSTSLLRILRDPGFTAAVTVKFESATTGLSATALVFPADQLTLDFPISVSNTATLGKRDATIIGTTPGQADARRPITVEVKGFDLKPRAALLTVVAGSSGTDTVDIDRYAFTGAVTFSATTDQGISIETDSASTSGGRVVLKVETTSATAAGRHSVVLKGTSGTSVETASFNVDVTVPAPAGPTIAVTPTSLQLQVGEQKPVTATVTNAAGTSPVTWVSKDPSIVTASPASVVALSSGASTNFAGVRAGGPVDVVASYTANGTTVTATVSVTVTAPPVNGVTAMYLDPVASEYTSSGGNFYRARLLGAAGNEISSITDGGTLGYSSSDTTVIKIDASSGLAQTKKRTITGTATITAVYTKNGQAVVSAVTPVTVFPTGGADMGAVQISVAGDARRITVGQTIAFQVIVRDQNGIQQTSAAVQSQLLVTPSSTSALQITPVASTNPYQYTTTAKALPASSALAGIANVVTIKADVNGAMWATPMIILP